MGEGAGEWGSERGSGGVSVGEEDVCLAER